MEKHEATPSHGTTNVIPNDVPDNDSLETYEYTAILPKYQCMQSSIPERVHVSNTLPSPRMILTNLYINFVSFSNILLLTTVISNAILILAIETNQRILWYY